MKHFFTFVLLILTISTLAQTTDKISYQAVIRDSDNSLVAGSDIDIKILLRSGSSTGVVVYEEEHYTTTNMNGLVTLQIGTGRVVKGSFSGINWDKAPFFIETQVDPTGKANFTVIGVSEILSVPYALYAKSVSTFDGTISQSQITDLQHFSGNYDDLQNKPEPFSRNYNDLLNLPNLYTSAEVDSLIVNAGSTGTVQSLDLQNNQLSISGGNSISFENWDTDSSDDFSGNYNDLLNLPNLYTTSEVDSLIVNAGSNGTVQSLTMQDNKLSISGGNSIYFENWDTDSSDDFSGNYNDLLNLPNLYTISEVDSLIVNAGSNGTVQSLVLQNNELSISGGNSIYFENWDTDSSDDFSGNYNDLLNLPRLYTTAEVDSLIVNAGSTGTLQSLDLQDNRLSISGGNTISFNTWDTDASDDFSGNYYDLKDKPTLFSGNYKDLIDLPSLYTTGEVDSLFANAGSTGTVQSLDLQDNKLSISGGNSISFENWDTDASDDFSGNYNDLKDIPNLYTTAEVDSLIVNAGSTGTVQSLDLQNNKLSISGGNSISFDKWDTDSSDDFSGNYNDLQNIPEFFSGKYEDLQNKPESFSGDFKDLKNIPAIYTKTEVDNLINNNDNSEHIAQNLHLENENLTISGGNTVSYLGWDMNAADDFDGKYSSLSDRPDLYTRAQVDSITTNLLKKFEKEYYKKPVIINLASSRSIKNSDIENTIACTISSTLTINSGFEEMAVGQIINIEIHGTTLTVKGAMGVSVNGVQGGSANVGNNDAYTGGILRKTGSNSYIVL